TGVPSCHRCPLVSPRCPSYVEGIVALFYAEDQEVAEDEELQEWVGEIFTYGVLGNEKSGRGHRG
ncbi:ALOX8 lipoxygenase, partial [Molothrus ater]|nr:ALOX8 lipoxygenase [Molothrus ater]NXV54551.1 ALOX8 lipoxygenase [Molothrus ater]NXV56717.1 ALOX8 lipoxygenase [Molothrus ater]NXV59312.1 ALOX8 lipoxygenase [Molothrus ater]